jgi:NADH-quinone oxidoreductase subunit C|tara:strand:+ start:358 stop:1023 length:666 start_codon:yes stop_codon:yes gene_type:complete
VPNLNSIKKLITDNFKNYKVSIEDNLLLLKENETNDIFQFLKSNEKLSFDTLIDIIAIDYLEYGEYEWETKKSNNGYSRGYSNSSSFRKTFNDLDKNLDTSSNRFAVIYQLLSTINNTRLGVKVVCENNSNPNLDSVCSIWSSANWYEREAYDLFGIYFSGHPDLRRLLTDYGFVGHPLRKDFPLVGNSEVSYDIEKDRVVQKPVSIEPRVLVPKVIREED